MTKAFFANIVFLSILSADSSFITDYEYAKMLYKNPRGIGCDKCHGKDGSGKIISYYRSKKGKKLSLKAPSIKDISEKEFFKSFKKRHKVMPTYFLTTEEIESLYYYIKNQKKGK